MDTSIYRRPYFYIIQHINSGKYYAGVRYGKNANPDQLLKSNGYQTSSYIVKQIILEEGEKIFVYTDGLVENERFDRNTIIDILNKCNEKSAEEIDEILKEEITYRIGEDKKDDITYMILEKSC